MGQMTPFRNISHAEKEKRTRRDLNEISSLRQPDAPHPTLPVWKIGAPLRKRGHRNQVTQNRAQTSFSSRDGDASAPARCASMRIAKPCTQVQNWCRVATNSRSWWAQNTGWGSLTLMVFVDWHLTWCDTVAVWFMTGRQQSTNPRRSEQPFHPCSAACCWTRSLCLVCGSKRATASDSCSVQYVAGWDRAR